MKKRQVVKLSNQLKGKKVKIVALHFHDDFIKHKLSNLGFNKGALVQVLNFSYSNKILHLQLHNIQYILRENNCHLIDVQVI